MSEMLDRVSAAINESMRVQLGGSPYGFAGNPTAWTARATSGSLDIELLARAAIEAMREPTEAMLDEGPGDPYMDAGVWARMIDRALTGEPK